MLHITIIKHIKIIWFKFYKDRFKQRLERSEKMLAALLSGIANLFANSVSTACYFVAFDEPEADKELL